MPNVKGKKIKQIYIYLHKKIVIKNYLFPLDDTVCMLKLNFIVNHYIQRYSHRSIHYMIFLSNCSVT